MNDNDALAAIRDRLDEVSAQLRELTELAEEDGRRQRERDELVADLVPVANDAYRATVEQLGEIEPYVRVDDMLDLLKRLARNTRNIEAALDQLESASDFVRDAAPLTTDAVASLVAGLDALERRGAVAFLREAMYVMDNVMTAFTPEDVRLLGDNVVTILTAVKEMTQPEVMGLVQNVATRVRSTERDPGQVPTSIWGIMKMWNDPDTRRGLAITLDMLRAVGEEHATGAGAPSRDA